MTGLISTPALKMRIASMIQPILGFDQIGDTINFELARIVCFNLWLPARNRSLPLCHFLGGIHLGNAKHQLGGVAGKNGPGWCPALPWWSERLRQRRQ